MRSPHEPDFKDPDAKALWIEGMLVDYRDGTAAPEDVARLRALLLSDPESRKIYLRANQLSCLLETVTPGEPDCASPRQERGDASSRLSPRLLWGAGLAAAAVVLVGIFLFVSAKPEATVLATLSDSHDAMLSGTATIDGGGFKFGKGDLALSAGIAELAFSNGARVLLDGECRLEILDEATVRLSSGKIRVHCPFEARGFEVLTPGETKVVDLGTEFGVSVKKSGEIDLHVFDGFVDLIAKGEDKRTVEAGSAISVSATNEVSEHQAVEEMFTTAATLKRERWESHHREMLKRSDLLLYYDFSDTGTASPEIELNRAQAQAHGRILGARPVAGRIPGKGGLLFERPGDALAFQFAPPVAPDSLTIAMWVKFDRFENLLSTLLNSNGWSRGDLHFQVTKHGNLRSGVHGIGAFQTASGTVRPGEWNFVVVSWRIDAKQAQFSCNGVLLQSHEHPNGVAPSETKPSLGLCQIGAWGDPNLVNFPKARNFKGRVDEVMVFDRALSITEIDTLYRASQP